MPGFFFLPLMLVLLAAVAPPAAEAAGPVSRPGAPASAAAPAPLPAVNFWIDLREVDEPLQAESANGSVGTVLGTAGAGQGAGGRANAAAEAPLDTHLRLANGGQGRLAWRQARAQDRVAVAWAGPGDGARPATAGATASVSSAGQAAVAVQREWLASGWQVALAARWAGGDAPVALDATVTQQAVDDTGAGDAPTTRSLSTDTQVLARLDQWVTLTRTAAPEGPPAGAGVTSTRREWPARLLQVRVRLAAPLAAPPRPLPR